MLRNSFFKIIPFLFFIFLFNSCDKEFSVVGNEIIDNPSFAIEKEEFPVVAYNQKLGPIQSNDMPLNALGIYDNPAFGTTKATFVTQVALDKLTNTFDKTAKIKKVVLTIPYFSHKDPNVAVGSDGSTKYILDSIYGPDKAKMKLSIYESGYFMRDLDPEDQFTQAQKYYTNQYSDFLAVKKDVLLNDSSNEEQNKLFFFDPNEHVVTTPANGTTAATTTRSAPGMQLDLNAAFFQTKILGAPANVLASDALFKEYFRGLVFDIQTADPKGNMAMINFKKGVITVTYEETIKNTTTNKDEVTEKTMLINLTGHTSSFLEQSDINQEYANNTPIEPDETYKAKGDENLYLKGGEGSMSVLKLFSPVDNHGLELTDGPNGVSDQLDDMRRNKYLVNQAEITFHLNSTAMGSGDYIYFPKRIYLYDYTNNVYLADYVDGTTSSADPKNNRFVFGGILAKQSEADGGGYIYKFRISEHIRKLVSDASLKNVDLGLVVTEDISTSNIFYALRNKAGFPLYAPMVSVMNPLGAIVFGNLADEKNRVKFEIYYTKAN